MSFHKKSKNTINDALYTELFTPLFKYIYFRTKDYNLATDLTQSSFLKYLKQAQNPVNREHRFRLLFTIARNLLIDHWRAEGRHKLESLEDMELYVIKSDDPTPDKIFEKNEDVILIKKILKLLSDIEEDIVTMRITSEMSYREIGKSLDVTPENARKIYSRALSKIKRSFEENKTLYNL